MSGSNAFGALAMDNSSPGAGPSRRQVEVLEVDADWLRLVKTNHDVNVRVSDKVDLHGLPHECNLMAVSNVWGLLVVGSSTDVRIHRLSEVHNLLETAGKETFPVSTPVQVIQLPSRPVWIRLAANEERLVVALSDGNGVLCWKLRDVLRGDTNPYHSFISGIPSHLLDLLPNPAAPSSEALANFVILLAKEGFVIADIEQCKLSNPVAGPFTSASWSAKGKQLVVGTLSGKLVQYTPDGTIKAEVPTPELDPPDPHYPAFLQWLENDLFLVSYAPIDGTLDAFHQVFVVQRTKASVTYSKIFDPLDTMGAPGKSGLHRSFAGLKTWGSRTKHLAFIMSAVASEIAVLHGPTPQADQASEWQPLILEETARAIMPAGKPGVTNDTACLGLELDLTSTKAIKQGIQGGVELPDLSPAPRIFVYSQEGVIISFNVLYPEGGTYTGMTGPQDLLTDTMEGVSTVDAASVDESSTNPAGSAVNTTPAKPAAFGSSAFGQTAVPSFGARPTFGSPAFGQSSKPVAATPANTALSVPSPSRTAFGQPSSGQASKLAFGSSAFGSTTPTAFGQSGSGQSTTSPVSTSSNTPFGSLGFGAFGNNQTSVPTGFSFGPSKVGQKSEPAASVPGFGSRAFGGGSVSGRGTAFGGGSAFGRASAFGGSSEFASSSSAFGSPSSFGQSGGSSPAFAAFGAHSTSASTGFSRIGASQSSPEQQSSVPDDLDLDEFASALDTSTKASDIPGLESPPDSPVLGSTKKPAGLDEDSPPNSPPVKPAASIPHQMTPSSGSSFIKPATAFGGTASSGFGSFGNPASKPSTTFGSKPAALSAPPSSPSPPLASPSAFGSVAFGQPSNPGSSKPSGFGGSAFGQSSVPVASGQTAATKAISSGFGNITGGFGAFTSKPVTPNEANKTAFGGFGGVATGTSSAFSDTKPSSSFLGFGQKEKPALPPSGTPAKVPTAALPEVDPESISPHIVPPKANDDANEAKGYDVPAIPATPPPHNRTPSSENESSTPILPAGVISEKPDEHRPNILRPSSGQVNDDHTASAEVEAEESDETSEEGNEDDEVYSEGEDDENSGEDDFEAEEEDEADSQDNDSTAGEDEEEARVVTQEEPLMSSISSGHEMSPIQEESDREDDTDHEIVDRVEARPKRVKSPAWFAQITRSSSETEHDVEDGLDPMQTPAPSRVDQPAIYSPAQKGPTFALKHAPSRSSPLGSQPPQNADESTTSPVSPAKLPVSRYAPFMPAEEQRTPSSKVSEEGSVDSLFEPQPPVPAKAQPAGPKPSFGFGLGKPPTACVQPQHLPAERGSSPVSSFSFAPKPQEVKPAAKPPTSFFSTIKTAPPLQPTTFAPEPPPVSSSFEVPKRPDLVRAQQKLPPTKTMAAVVESMIAGMEADLSALKTNLERTATYHRTFEMANFVKISAENITNLRMIPFSSIPDVATVIDEKVSAFTPQTGEAKASEMKLAELQSQMTKTDMKMGQADKMMRSRQDPSFVRVMQVRDLSPQQASHQAKFRRGVQAAEARFREVENGVAGSKKRANRRPSGGEAGDITTSPLERLQRSVRNVDSAIRDRQQTIDDLAKRIGAVRIATPPRSREGSATPPSGSKHAPGSPSVSVLSTLPISFEAPPDVLAEVAALFDAERPGTNPFSTISQTRITNASSHSPEKGASRHTALRDGPIMIDALPLPGLLDSQPVLSPPTSPSASTPSDSTSMFGGIKLSLDPASLVSNPIATSSSTRTPRGQSTHRSHVTAAKFSGSAQSTSAASPPSDIAFELPPSSKASSTPSGFFSFGGYGK